MTFSAQLFIQPVTAMDRPKTDMECGGKVILPPSILHTLSGGSFFERSPILFKIQFEEISTHCGVLEFIAEEGCVYAPSWIFDVLQAHSGGKVQISTVHLPKATFARFQPQSTDFLDITDPRAVLENHLRGFACLTKDDIIPIFYNNRIYHFKIEEIKPSNAVCINECDMVVEFSTPAGYVETRQEESSPREVIVEGNSIAFTGVGYRIDGKKTGESEVIKWSSSKVGQPDYEFNFGILEFFRGIEKMNKPQSSQSS